MRDSTARLLVASSLLALLGLAGGGVARAQDDDDYQEDGSDDTSGDTSGEGGPGGILTENPDWPTDRPTSGDVSLFSGRTVGAGETVIAAGVGWPGLWAGIWLAPSSTFNIGIEGHVFYGSPFMGFSTGVGGGLSLPTRIFLWGKKTLDLALFIEPTFVIGEASLTGETGAWAGQLGLGVNGIAELLVGLKVSDAVTLNLGLGGNFGFVYLGDRDSGDVLGGVLGQLGIEALMARDFMLFATVRGGYGFARNVGAPVGLFESPTILHAYLGMAFLL